MSIESIHNNNDDNEQGTGSFDFKRFTNTLLHYWYVFAITLAVTLAIAKWYYWYAVPKYSAAVTMLIKDEKDANLSTEKLLQQFEDDVPKHNMSNEIELLQSRSIMAQVVNELPLGITYLSRKRLKKSDLYKNTPIIVTCDSLYTNAYRTTLCVNVIDTSSFEIGIDGSEEKKIIAKFGQKTSTPVGELTVTKAPLFDSPQYKKERLVDRDFLVRFTSPEALIQRYSAAVTVDKVNRESTILQLTLTDIVAERAMDVLNKVCEVYLRNDINHKNKVASNTLHFIDDQLSVTSTDLKNIENNIERFRSGNRISTDISTEANLYLKNAHEADMNMSQVRYKYNVADYIEKFIKGNNNLDDMSISVSGIDEPQLNKLIDELRLLEAKKNQYTLAAKADNPLIINLNYQLERTRESIINNISAIKKNLQLLMDDKQGSINKYETQLRSVPHSERQMLGLKRQFDIKEQMYLFLLQKRAETSIALASTVSDSHVVDSAEASNAPISPIKTKIYTIAFLISILLPLLFVYLKTISNKTISTKDVVASLTRTPIVGLVSFGDSNEEQTKEQFRELRTNLTYMGVGTKQVVLVTSSITNEGKTLVAQRLANTIAMAGKATIVINCNLRATNTTSKQQGLSNYLMDNASLKDIVQLTTTNVAIITSGTGTDNASELLLNHRMEQLITTLQEGFDTIIIDAPALGIVSDAFALVKFVNVILYVVRTEVTKRSHITFLNELIATKKLHNVAIVVNDVTSNENLHGFTTSVTTPIYTLLYDKFMGVVNKFKKQG